MLIVCPSCASTYSLTPEQLGGGSAAALRGCRHEWFATPPADDEPAIPALDAAPEASADASAAAAAAFEAGAEATAASASAGKPAKRGRGRGRAGAKPSVPLGQRLAGLAAAARRLRPAHAAIALLVLLAVGAVLQRQTIVRMLPADREALCGGRTARELARPRVPRRHVVAAARRRPARILVVEGEIRSIARATREVPRLQLSACVPATGTRSMPGPPSRRAPRWSRASRRPSAPGSSRRRARAATS